MSRFVKTTAICVAAANMAGGNGIAMAFAKECSA